MSNNSPFGSSDNGKKSAHFHYQEQPSGHSPHREPAINAPGVIIALIIGLTLIHWVRGLLSENEGLDLLLALAFIPARLTAFIYPAEAQAILDTAVAAGPQQAALAHYILSGSGAPWTLLTYAFLHGSWMHLVFNALWLLAFGAPVARRFGVWRFIALFVLCGIAGALFFWIMRPLEVLPMIGASGAVSGIMAAAVRFIFTENGAGIFGRRLASGIQVPAQPLIETFMNKQALGFIIAWFFINLLAGMASGIVGVEGAIAWEAHIGGFIAGLALFAPLDPVSRKSKS